MSQGKPWPVFVRVGGHNARGEPALQDNQYNEVLEWDSDLDPKPNPQSPGTYPQLITGAPIITKRGLFDRPNVKIF